MQLEPATLIFVFGLVAAGGAAAWRISSLETRTRELEAFRIRAGERLGKLEVDARYMRRSLTAPAGNQVVGAGPVVDAGGRVLAPVPDGESSE